MRSGGGISIWFFVGISLLVNGALTLGAGLWEMAHPPANPVVLFQYHANVWWGAALFLLGVVYSVKFSPQRVSS
jgi:FtsH-binding integral membrane protein